MVECADEFYREISAHPIPTDLEGVKALAGSPVVLDLFMWFSYRCFLSKARESIPLLGTYGLANQIGLIEYAQRDDSEKSSDGWLNSIRMVWPECLVRISADGRSLMIDQGSAFLIE